MVEVSCPTFVHALATYYLILPAEASSNLAKFDAMRYGLRGPNETICTACAASTHAIGYAARATYLLLTGQLAESDLVMVVESEDSVDIEPTSAQGSRA